MGAKGRSRLLVVAFALASFVSLALWASSTSSRFRLGPDWSLSTEPSIDNPTLGGVGSGSGTGEVEWEEGWAEEKAELSKGGEVDGELALEGGARTSAPTKSLPSPSSIAIASSTILPSAPSAHPLLPPLPPRELSLLRKDYLRRIANMSDFHPTVVNATHNERMFRKLERCLEDGEEGKGLCATEVPKVIVVTEFYFACGFDHCSTTGEVIWLAPVGASLEKQGHFTLNYDDGDLVEVWDRLGDLITQIWMTDQAMIDCFANTEECIESSVNPRGIPAWKLFALTFWGSIPGAEWWGAPEKPWSFSPLGAEWILTPYSMPDNHTYLGYTFEGCTDVDVVPPSERSNNVFVLAKYVEYFHRPEAWPLSLYASLVNATGLDLITTAKPRDDQDPFELPAGVRSIGRLEKLEYSRVVGSSKVMLGIGRPGISPSPYAALCQAVPVILPYFTNLSHPLGWDAFRDTHQHAIAASIGPPYVYSVNLHGPMENLINTIQTAVNTPIERYVPPEMTPEALDARVDTLVRTDWQKFARTKGWRPQGEEGGMSLSLPGFLEAHAQRGRFGRGKGSG